ncbi:MAG: histidine kinase [Actinobacteria bacterium]|nr:histidine kinase [Actinomycetota bacterium]
MNHRSTPAMLRTLYLFEQLTDPELQLLCEQGRIETRPPGVLITEGDPATCFYVMIEGEMLMSGRLGGFDIQTHRTTERGTYCGAWSAYIPEAAQVYEVSVRLERQSTFFVLDADRFADFMRSEFPIAVHLLAGHTVDSVRQQQILGQRARLLALGTITAGLTHHLNNPAAAIARAAGGLTGRYGGVGRKQALVAEALCTRDALHALFDLQQYAADQIRTSTMGSASALKRAQREERIDDWLHEYGIAGWDCASTFAEAGLDVDWLQQVSSLVATIADGPDQFAGTLQLAVESLRESVDSDLRVREVIESCNRISALLTGAKHYSQMDRGTYQRVDVHELLQATLMMFDGRIGSGSGIRLVTEWDRTLPEINCYAGDLNQVWTNIIENAVHALAGGGTLTIRTMSDGETLIRVEVCDDGPGIPHDIIDRVFTPFFTTKPVGEGIGLGLDLAWRIVATHAGNLTVESEPGDTRFIIRLPLHAPTREPLA